MNRNEFQRIARARVADARVLLGAKRYSGAYYLCGYAIECALKACIAKRTLQYDFPPVNVRDAFYTHNLTILIKTAGLERAHHLNRVADPLFGVNWTTIKDWSEGSRYDWHSPKDANHLYQAVVNRDHGVLPWLMRYW
jgi:hypothetical protein